MLCANVIIYLEMYRKIKWINELKEMDRERDREREKQRGREIGRAHV